MCTGAYIFVSGWMCCINQSIALSYPHSWTVVLLYAISSSLHNLFFGQQSDMMEYKIES